MVVTNDLLYCFDNQLVFNPKPYKNWKDDLLKEIDAILQPIVKQKLDCANNDDKLGRKEKARKLYKEVFFYQNLSDYMVMFQEKWNELGCLGEDALEELKEELKLECVKNTATCRYKAGKLVDQLFNLLDFTCCDLIEFDCAEFNTTEFY